MKTILLTNDDGVYSEGIVRLRDHLAETHEVYIVAPDRERSAISMALTLNHPLRIDHLKDNIYATDGTPADCINLAIQKILPRRPDFIISGMNFGENLSEDIFFSGTVGAAFAGYLYGIPSMAISLIPDQGDARPGSDQVRQGAKITDKILSKLLSAKKIPVVFNVNIPIRNNGKILLTSLGNKRYKPEIIEKKDPRGKMYYWIGTGNPVYVGEKGTDIWAIRNRYISLSAIYYHLSKNDIPEELEGLFDEI
jgi:5'-nucleotidase